MLKPRGRAAAAGLRFALLAAALAVASALAHSKAVFSPLEGRRLFERSRTAIQEGHPEVGLALAEEMLAFRPEEPLYLTLRFRALMIMRRWPEAVRAGEVVARVSPKTEQVCPGLGQAYAMVGDLERAAKAQKRCLDSAPTPEALFEYGQALERLEQFDEAVKVYSAVHAASPTFIGASLCIARIRVKQGRLAEARGIVRKVLSLKPRHPGALAVGELMRRAEAGSRRAK